VVTPLASHLTMAATISSICRMMLAAKPKGSGVFDSRPFALFAGKNGNAPVDGPACCRSGGTQPEYLTPKVLNIRPVVPTRSGQTATTSRFFDVRRRKRIFPA
jgi:hypothetical protein